MRKQISFICCAIIAYCLSACDTTPQRVPLKEKSLPKYVILIGFDGLSARCLNNRANMPTFRKMMAEGASTLEDRSVLPSSNACDWASMFIRARPELYGHAGWGSRTPELPSRVVNSDNRFPDIFGMYQDETPEAETDYIYKWEGANYLVGTLTMSFHRHVPISAENPNGCTPVAVQYIKEKKPGLCTIIHDQPDGTEHGKGWSPPEYFAMVNYLDSCLTQVVGAVREAGIMDNTVVILTADHDGVETGHGGKTMNEMRAPIVFYGKNVKKGLKIPESMMVCDIAGTMAYLLGVPQPQIWIARPTLSAFEGN